MIIYFFYDVELYNFAREKQNWVKGKGGGGGGAEMLIFNTIFVDKYTKGHIIELRLTC